MPCNCGDAVQIGTHPPYANVADVTQAFEQLKNCCIGAVANTTDPIDSPAAALAEGFPDGLKTECGCDVLWLVRPDGSTYISSDGGQNWFVATGPSSGNAFGVLVDHADPNTGGGAFITQPDCVDPHNPCWAADSKGSIWASFDRGTTWLQAHQAPYFVSTLGTSGLPSCSAGVLTTMNSYAVVDGDSSLYNSVTGEVTIPVDGLYEVQHRVEFSAGTLASGALIQSEVAANGSVLRQSQSLIGAHGSASHPTSSFGGQPAVLNANDVLTHRVRITGTTASPAAGSLIVRLIARL